MSQSIEDQQFRVWLRRPTIFIANAWYLLASAGQSILGYLAAVLVNAIPALTASGGYAASYASTILYEIALLALPVVWYAAKHEGVSQSMRLNPPRIGAMLYAALTAVVGLLAVNTLGTWWMLIVEALGGRLYDSSIPVPTNMDELTFAILAVGVVPGVCEELLFRGGLMGAWERRGTKKALVITSVLFALLHGSVLGFPTQLLMGFVLGYILIVSDSLYVTMTYHTVHNSTALLMSYLSAQMQDASSSAGLTLAETVAMSGGYFSLVMDTLMLCGTFAYMLWVLRLPMFRRPSPTEPIVTGDRSEMNWQELLVLLAGLVTVGIWFAEDILLICGVI